MGIQIPYLLGNTKNTEGVPKFLGDLNRGCQILGGAGSPMTPDRVELCLKEDGDRFLFHFTLPLDGLALRSVAIVDDVPEIYDSMRRIKFQRSTKKTLP